MDKDTIIYKGQRYSILVVDVIDYQILGAFTHQECEDKGWHHTFYMDQTLARKVDDEEAVTIWIYDGGLRGMDGMIQNPMKDHVLNQIEILRR
jgi:hypothetical protein